MKSILITSSILIVLIAALRPLLRGRIDPRVQYALWLIVALRLLVPVELASSAYSALALLERAKEPARVVEAIGQTTVPIPGMSYADAYDQALHEYHQNQAVTTNFTDLEQVERRTQELMEQTFTLSGLAEAYARPVWLGGTALMAAWFLLVNLKLRQRLRTALPAEADCPLPVRVTPDLPSPCLCGAVRPVIYVTPSALADPDRMRHVLAHEATHYRHRDHWWALVRCLCLCLYWFDPLVWWAAALSRQDCELACDAGAIRRLGEEERLPYGRTLVDMIAAGRCSLLQTATTMTGSKRRVRERVCLIARKPKTVIAVALALALVLGAAVGCTFTGAPESSPDPPPLSSDALNTATLPSRLMDVPEDLRADVEAIRGSDPTVLAEYWLDRPYTDYEWGWGYLLTVYAMDEGQLASSGYTTVTGQWDLFAKQGDTCYLTRRASDVRVPASPEMVAEIPGATEVETKYLETLEAIKAFVEKTVLETEGVEPFDPYATPPHFFSNVPQLPLEPGRYAIDGLDYTLVTSYEDVPEDPEQWYLVGQLPNQPLWMFTRDRGAETMFQIDGELTQVFPYRACYYGGPQTHDGRAPQLMRLWGGGNGNGTYDGAFAVITHLFQGGTDQEYQLTAYNLDADPVASYVHNWRALMEDFNANSVSVVHEDTHSVTVTYQGTSAEIQTDDIFWDNVQQYGFSAETYEYCMNYYFNDDGTFDLAMPVNPYTIDQVAVWTLRFTGNSFENVGFRFDQSDDTYTYISTVH